MLTVLDKRGPALRTSHLDPAFPFRNTNLLSAGRAGVDVVGFALLPDTFLSLEKGAYLIYLCEKCLILRVALRYVP